MTVDLLKPLKLRSIETPDKPGSLEDHIREMGELGGVVELLRQRAAQGRVVTQDEWAAIEEKEAHTLRSMIQAQEDIKALQQSASRFSGSMSDVVTIDRAQMVLNAPEDEEFKAKKIDRTYFNLAALSSAELLGLADMQGEVPGLSAGALAIARTGKPSTQAYMVDRFKHLHDRLYIKDVLMCGRGRTRYAQLGGPEARMSTLKEWKEYEKIGTELYRAASQNEGTGSLGGFLVPVILSSRIGDLVEIFGRVAAIFPRFPMTSKTYEWPFQLTHMTPYTVAEGANDDQSTGSITPSTATFAKPVWTANKLATLVFTSTELDEDSITPMISWFEKEVARVLVRGVEHATMSGERAGATMDGAFNAAGSALRLVNGLRYHALMTASYPGVQDCSGTVSETFGITLQGNMGAWGVTPSDFAWVANFRGYAGLRKIANYQTIDKIGPQASLRTGLVGEFLGSPVILADQLPLTHTDGKVSATPGNNIKGSVIGVQPSRWAYGDRRAITVDTSEHIAFKNDQVAIRATQRIDFEPMDGQGSTPALDATHTPVGLLFNIN